MTWWADVNARARGLAGHLIDDPGWHRVHAAPDFASLCQEVRRAGYPVVPGSDARTAERAIERERRDRQALLARWVGRRGHVLRFLLEAEDRRAIRALLRGAASGLPASARAAVVPPSCGLTPGMIAAAAATSDETECLSALVSLEQPLAVRTGIEWESVRDAAPGLAPLLALEFSLSRAWAARALEGVRRADRGLRELVGAWIDLENAGCALRLVREPGLPAEVVFLPGGASLSREAFDACLDAADRASSRSRLAEDVGSPLGELLADPDVPTREIERTALRAEVRRQERERRRAPLGPGPVLDYLLRLRLEAQDLRGILWARALGVPPGPAGVAGGAP